MDGFFFLLMFIFIISLFLKTALLLVMALEKLQVCIVCMNLCVREKERGRGEREITGLEGENERNLV